LDCSRAKLSLETAPPFSALKEGNVFNSLREEAHC
jgi:hypothetical protein